MEIVICFILTLPVQKDTLACVFSGPFAGLGPQDAEAVPDAAAKG
jgi:hypothetical protein